jgi:hypothetical protein
MADGGKAATGALSGAATGATLGSVVPGIGTAVGAIGGALIGGISGLFSGGDDFQAEHAELQNPTTAAQAQAAYGQSQMSLGQQQAFLQALQGQNGIQNQSQVFNQLQGVANGTGPNPAQAMLNNATGQNVANQAALMAGQRGASANAGLIARQAAQNGANLQQQAVGQGAALQASQGLNAMTQMGTIAGQQVANQSAATGALNQYSMAQQQMLLNSIAQQNQSAVANASQYNAAMAGTDGNRQKSGDILGSAGAAIGTIAPLLGGGSGGSGGMTMPEMGSSSTGAAGAGVNNSNGQFGGLGGGYKFAEGGEVPSQSQPNGPKSRVAMHLKGVSITMHTGGVVPTMNTGGNVPALVSPGEKVLSPAEAKQVAQGANINQIGKQVPGKAPVKGDSLKNDIVPAKLQEGGMVIPKSVMESDDPVKHAIAFVRAHMSKQSAMKKKA